MKILRKIAGFSLLACAVIAILLEALAAYVQITEWIKYGDFPQGWDALLILSAVVLGIAGACTFFGIRFAFDKKQKQDLSFAQKEAASESPSAAASTAVKGADYKGPSSVFSSSVVYLLYATALGAVVSFLIIYLLSITVFSGVIMSPVFENAARIVLAIAIGIGWALLFCNVNIVVDYNGMHFHRNGKNYLSIGLYDIESVKSSTVIYGFIPIVVRVVAYKSGNKTKRKTCHCFSKKEFDEMVDIVNMYRREVAAAAQAKEETAQQQ